MANTTWINWSALESKHFEEERIALNQALSQLAVPNEVEDTPYKSQMVEAGQNVLKQLETSGDAKQENSKMLIKKSLIPDDFYKCLDKWRILFTL